MISILAIPIHSKGVSSLVIFCIQVTFTISTAMISSTASISWAIIMPLATSWRRVPICSLADALELTQGLVDEDNGTNYGRNSLEDFMRLLGVCQCWTGVFPLDKPLLKRLLVLLCPQFIGANLSCQNMNQDHSILDIFWNFWGCGYIFGLLATFLFGGTSSDNRLFLVNWLSNKYRPAKQRQYMY